MGILESGETGLGSLHHCTRLRITRSLSVSVMPLDVSSPASLAEPINVPLKTMTGPGPSNVNDRVLQAQALPTLGHLHPEFTKNCWRRHRLCADHLHSGLKDLGLELFVANPAARLPTVTTIKVPEGINWQAVAGHCMKNHLVEISRGS